MLFLLYGCITGKSEHNEMIKCFSFLFSRPLNHKKSVYLFNFHINVKCCSFALIFTLGISKDALPSLENYWIPLWNYVCYTI